ncbi:hypothetical protein IQ231_22635 [Cuspidothrix issatschenkoi LEGE 03284]|jgi:hypothetical protein|uniref:hypothetical protein n=1 Tax=Cuspidothrix issatschenkoi TaxID=230752 RepID=UPI001880C2A3|nr:hypothetical protein [Cuspidothrix issatschenkoi]MBE9234361.1 hypothetical protein [Cuspidothrix issatschenkoi LEGE 03284]
MSLITSIEHYELTAKRNSLAHLISQFSGILAVDYKGNISSGVNYFVNDGAVRFREVENTLSGPRVVEKTQRAWALPGYLIESIKRPQISPGIELPTLPTGAVSTKPADVLLITTIPYYWYPQVPNGNQLNSYELRFDIPFLDLKNNRQLFKVAQNSILEEGVLVIQLSSQPATNINISSVGGTFDFNFT